MAQAARAATPAENTTEAAREEQRYSFEELRLTVDEPNVRFSPARQMQDALGREFAAVEAVEAWPVRRTVALVMFACGAFWTAVYFAVAAIAG